MSDAEEDYSSEEDSDYRPSGDEGSEDGSDKEHKVKDPENTKQQKDLKRKRKGGIQLSGDEEDEIASEEKEEEERRKQLKKEEEEKLLEMKKEEEKKRQEEAEKKKSDDLWKSLMSDVGQKPKVKRKGETLQQQENPQKKESDKKAQSENSTDAPEKEDVPKKEVSKDENDSKKEETLTKKDIPSTEKTITITKVFDFAGEEVKINKEVAADSKEAKSFLKSSTTPENPPSKPGISGIPSGFKRKPGGLGNVLGAINKKSKMSVLDKSKMDWNSFKTKEGISEELKIHNKGKGGYLQKQEFLSETDLRQYEIERKMRMGMGKR